MDTTENIRKLIERVEESFGELLRARAEQASEVDRLRELLTARDEEAVTLLRERTRELEDAQIEIERLEQELRRADSKVRDLNDALTALAQSK